MKKIKALSEPDKDVVKVNEGLLHNDTFTSCKPSRLRWRTLWQVEKPLGPPTPYYRHEKIKTSKRLIYLFSYTT